MQKNSSLILPNPFPGLRPFTTDESHLFFGREGQSETIVNYLSNYKFAAVTGASGSGKSSLIYCGVVPLLFGGFITKAGSNWKLLTARPGSNPIWNLAKAFAKAESDENKTQNTAELKEFYYSLLNRHSLGLADAIKQVFPQFKGNLLLVIDQFEELFRYKDNYEGVNEHHDDPRAFIKLLVNIIQQEKLPVYVVLTMRSDFIGDCSDYQDLTALINKSNYLVPQMTREDFENVIMGPIRVAGADMEPRLEQEILNSIESNHDQLPVLQHVLMRTWEFWAKNNNTSTPLNIRDYLAAGRLENALSIHANEAFNSLSEQEKEICQILFRSLTERGKEGKGIRRPASVQEISEIALVSTDEIIRIVEVFRQPGRSFLTPTSGTEISPSTIIDISHESLMRVWDKLRGWVENEASSASMYLRLIELSGLYQSGRSGLMQPPDLQVAINWRKKQNPNRAWARRYNPAFEKAMVFLNTSEKKYQQDEHNKVQIQHRELHRTRRIAIILGVVAIAFLGLMFYTYRLSQEAISQKERAETYANIVEGEKEEVLELSKEQKYQLLRERERLDSLTKARQSQLMVSPESNQNYQELVEEVSRRTKELEQSIQLVEKEKQKADLYAQTVDAERSKVAIVAKAEIRKRMLVLSSAIAIKSNQVNDDQLSGLLAYQAFLINRENGGQINHPEIYSALYNALRKLKGQKYNTLKGHSSPINSLVFDPARNLLYSCDTDGEVFRWSFKRTDSKPTTILTNEDGNTTIDITSDGRWMASGSESGVVRIVNTQQPNQAPRNIKAHNGRIIDIQFVPGKNAIITSGSDNTIKYWDLLTTEGITILTDESGFTDIDAAPSGKYIICTSANGKLLKWNVQDKKKELIYMHTTSLHSVTYDYESEKIAIGDRDGKILFINSLNGKIIKSIQAHASRVLDLEFSSDNRLLASSGLDGIIRIWNVNDFNDLPIEIREHESWVESIAFSPDGENLLSTSNDGNSIYIWPVKAENLIQEICPYLNRQLTNLEWNNFIGKDIDFRKVCE